MLSDVSVQRNWYETVSKLYQKVNVYCARFRIRFVDLNRSYSTNTQTTIFQRSLKNSGLLLLLFEFNNFSFLIDIIENISNTSESRDQNSHYNGSAVALSHVSVCITWLVYCTAIGWISGDLIRTYKKYY